MNFSPKILLQNITRIHPESSRASSWDAAYWLDVDYFYIGCSTSLPFPSVSIMMRRSFCRLCQLGFSASCWLSVCFFSVQIKLRFDYVEDFFYLFLNGLISPTVAKHKPYYFQILPQSRFLKPGPLNFSIISLPKNSHLSHVLFNCFFTKMKKTWLKFFPVAICLKRVNNTQLDILMMTEFSSFI